MGALHVVQKAADIVRIIHVKESSFHFPVLRRGSQETIFIVCDVPMCSACRAHQSGHSVHLKLTRQYLCSRAGQDQPGSEQDHSPELHQAEGLSSACRGGLHRLPVHVAVLCAAHVRWRAANNLQRHDS